MCTFAKTASFITPKRVARLEQVHRTTADWRFGLATGCARGASTIVMEGAEILPPIGPLGFWVFGVFGTMSPWPLLDFHKGNDG
jgi:hypothetical protein